MQGLRRLLRVDTKKLTFAIGLALAVAGVIGGGVMGTHRAFANDCDNNAIIRCGFSTKDDFIAKVRANDNQNGIHDLQAFYANFGLSASDYDNFVQHAVLGSAMRDGRIIVNNQVVGTNGASFGRSLAWHQPNPIVRTINGTSYYGNVPNITFAPGVQSIPIYVLFDDQGNFRFAVMPACGNTEIVTNVPSSASCNALNATPVSGQANTYSFTAAASTSGNAAVKTFEYNFGDGSPVVSESNGNTPVTHTYTKPGSFTASVTVHVSVPGNNDLQVTSTTLCTKTIIVVSVSCVQLVGDVVDKSKMSFIFTATGQSSGGAVLTSADFDFGDGNTETDVKPASATTVTVPHAYANSGQFNASAVLHYSTPNGPVSAATCKALVTPETVTPECKPGVPIGSPQCLPPCQPGSSVPPESAQCQPPLPNTGAGNTIALFAGVLVAGFLVYRQLLFRKHRAAYAAAQIGTSPLPLGDPLSDQPLDGTPLAAPQPRSFRRKRLF